MEYFSLIGALKRHGLDVNQKYSNQQNLHVKQSQEINLYPLAVGENIAVMGVPQPSPSKIIQASSIQEEEFQSESQEDEIESLISLNNQLIQEAPGSASILAAQPPDDERGGEPLSSIDSQSKDNFHNQYSEEETAENPNKQYTMESEIMQKTEQKENQKLENQIQKPENQIQKSENQIQKSENQIEKFEIQDQKSEISEKYNSEEEDVPDFNHFEKVQVNQNSKQLIEPEDFLTTMKNDEFTQKKESPIAKFPTPILMESSEQLIIIKRDTPRDSYINNESAFIESQPEFTFFQERPQIEIIEENIDPSTSKSEVQSPKSYAQKLDFEPQKEVLQMPVIANKISQPMKSNSKSSLKSPSKSPQKSDLKASAKLQKQLEESENQVKQLKKQIKKVVQDNQQLLKESNDNSRLIVSLKKQLKCLKEEMNEAQLSIQNKQNDYEKESQNLKKAYEELRIQYTALSNQQLQNLNKEPSNLTILNSEGPNIQEQELMKENEFLKSRLQYQQKQIANQDLVYLSQQNRLLSQRVSSLLTHIEDLTHKNTQLLSSHQGLQNIVNYKQMQSQVDEMQQTIEKLNLQNSQKDKEIDAKCDQIDFQQGLLKNQSLEISSLQYQISELEEQQKVQSEMRLQFENFVKSNILHQNQVLNINKADASSQLVEIQQSQDENLTDEEEEDNHVQSFKLDFEVTEKILVQSESQRLLENFVKEGQPKVMQTMRQKRKAGPQGFGSSIQTGRLPSMEKNYQTMQEKVEPKLKYQTNSSGAVVSAVVAPRVRRQPKPPVNVVDEINLRKIKK